MEEFSLNKITDSERVVPAKPAVAVIALRGQVIYPSQVSNLELAREESKAALELARANRENLFLVAQKDDGIEAPTAKDLFTVGVTARIQQVVKLPNGNVRVLVTGLERSKISEIISTSPCITATIEPFERKPSPEAEMAPLRRAIKTQMEEFVGVDGKLAKEKFAALKYDRDDKFIAGAGALLFDSVAEKQSLLEAETDYEALLRSYEKLVGLCDVLAAEKRIAEKVRESVDKGQKEYYLREQIKAIHSELGDDEEEIENFREQAEKKGLPDYAKEKLDKELNRMSKMAPSSPEAGIIRTYVEWMLDLPWTDSPVADVDLAHAREILDEDHYGLEKVKERIIEQLAVNKLSGNLHGTVLCFVGPPGVGKTSIVSSIARASGRKLVQMSLGGVRDEAEIRGHRRTYIGAMPGRIVSGMKTAGVNNPVFLLDEIDKMSSDFRGDPASAMLEVLDPNQNDKFKDHYLEIPYDLSKTMFVCTANTLDTVPQPLLDRMEVISVNGYTQAEKLQIAKRYLLPKQLKANGMSGACVTMSDEVLVELIDGYTKESGVRSLEREIGKVVRKIAVRVVAGEKIESVCEVTPELLVKYLGERKFKGEEIRTEGEVGLVRGLAWTSVGGVTLDTEVALIGESKGDIILTGSMGDVMKESARIALSVVKTRASDFGIDSHAFEKTDVHIHLPEGATPKDGPSAGITLVTAIASAFSGKKVRADVAMTGEVTLRGRVLAIGGLKEKSLAALRAGVKTLIIPRQNESDIAELPEEVKSGLEIVPVETIGEVLAIALEK